MTLHVTLLPGLIALAALSTGCHQALAEDPVIRDPEVTYVRVSEVVAGGYRIVAQTTPPPDTIFTIVSSPIEVKEGMTLTCEPYQNGILKCEEVFLTYIGCFEPEPVAQPPVAHVSLRR